MYGDYVTVRTCGICVDYWSMPYRRPERGCSDRRLRLIARKHNLQKRRKIFMQCYFARMDKDTNDQVHESGITGSRFEP